MTLTTVPQTDPAVPSAPEKDTLAESLQRQFKEETGSDAIPMEHYRILRQKYGLLPAQLTAEELEIIRKEGILATTIAA